MLYLHNDMQYIYIHIYIHICTALTPVNCGYALYYRSTFVLTYVSLIKL